VGTRREVLEAKTQLNCPKDTSELVHKEEEGHWRKGESMFPYKLWRVTGLLPGGGRQVGEEEKKGEQPAGARCS
jgi:hypothetical protein